MGGPQIPHPLFRSSRSQLIAPKATARASTGTPRRGRKSSQLFTDTTNQGQTLLPTLSSGALAQASFTPGGAFGLRVDNEYSTDSINNASGNTGGGRTPFPFLFPLVDSSG